MFSFHQLQSLGLYISAHSDLIPSPNESFRRFDYFLHELVELEPKKWVLLGPYWFTHARIPSTPSILDSFYDSVFIKYIPIVDLLYFDQVGILVESVDFESEHWLNWTCLPTYALNFVQSNRIKILPAVAWLVLFAGQTYFVVETYKAVDYFVVVAVGLSVSVRDFWNTKQSISKTILWLRNNEWSNSKCFAK